MSKILERGPSLTEQGKRRIEKSVYEVAKSQ